MNLKQSDRFFAVRSEVVSTLKHPSDIFPDMPATVDALAAQAVDLPEDQRLTLAYRILSTLEPPLSAEIEAAWGQEIAERIKKIREGTSKSIPADKVFAELDADLKK